MRAGSECPHSPGTGTPAFHPGVLEPRRGTIWLMLLHLLVETSDAVASTRKRSTKIELLADLLEGLDGDEAEIAVAFLSGQMRQGRIGVGWAALRDTSVAPASDPSLSIADVDAAFAEMKVTGGSGSQAERLAQLSSLLAGATESEQSFLERLLGGNLRQGALEGIVVEAVARAAGVPAAKVRRAAMFSGDAPAVARAAFEGGDLDQFGLQLFTPLKPMLAQSAESISEALEKTGPAAVEWKLDGARVQVHKLGAQVKLYTRNLKDMTGRVPELAARLAALPLESVVLDGEAIALRPDGTPYLFQESIQQFSSDDAVADVPLSAWFFDCLHLNGVDLVDEPADVRFEALAGALPPELVIPRLVAADAADAEAFYQAAIQAGHEGAVVKARDAPYAAGRRGAAWVKVKPTHTLDLVVLAVEWGSGRRQGWLSNIHLGARDPAGGFVMLGKTFKGMTDAMLAWQTERFLELETHREGHVVHLEPEQVVEVAFDGVQASPRYPGGVALRFARVKRYRDDKQASEADTIETVRSYYRG